MQKFFRPAKFAGTALSLTAAVWFAQPSWAAPQAQLTVDMNKPGAQISPLLYGIFFEEINRAGDGGIYAEMLQNRSFEDASNPVGWDALPSGNARTSLSLDKVQPLNTQNPSSLRVEIKAGGGRAGVYNQGFTDITPRPNIRPENWKPETKRVPGGIGVTKGATYAASLYARPDTNFKGQLNVNLETPEGKILASQKINLRGSQWQKFEVALKANATVPNARLVIASTQPGTFWLDMVSLFPRNTFKNRNNGLRADLMQKIDRINPAFVRFPGGCYVEGQRLADAFRWKDTIGDIAQRPGHWNLWGYHSTDGLGFHEYLQMCEDLKAEPLFVINVGMSHTDHVPMNEMGPWVQDALDAIEYANGPVTSTWGAKRAKNGHPAPFNMKMMQIGNENGGPLYNERYALFYDAIKAKYPQMQLVACDWGGLPTSRPVDISDPHLYSDPTTMMNQATRFDNADRKGHHIYFGEYAVTQEAGTGNLQAALGEAAFMTGLERNGDIVKMSSYAPLLVNPDWRAWNPNAVVFDASKNYGTPSYWVQTMFGQNRADRNLPVQITQPKTQEMSVPTGQIGLGTWRTQAEFKDVSVTKNGQTLWQSAGKNLADWKDNGKGQWKLEDGVLHQSATGEDVRLLAGDANWSDYTLSLKARKTGGDEGFLVMFQTPNSQTKNWLNLGGWENSAHALEVPGISSARINGKIENNRWYDIKIELQGQNIKAYLDGKKIFDVTRSQATPLYAVAGVDNKTGETILKVVNSYDQPIETKVDLRGAREVARRAKALVLGGAGDLAENSFEATTNIAPRQQEILLPATVFNHIFPANSVTVLRVKANA